MKNIIVAIGLLLSLGVSAHAAADTTVALPGKFPDPATKIIVARSSSAVSGMLIGQTATQVVVGSTTMTTQICVQNLDSAAVLACGESAIVTWMVSMANVGTMIYTSPGMAAPLCLPVLAGKNFYCASSAAAGSRASIRRDR